MLPAFALCLLGALALAAPADLLARLENALAAEQDPGFPVWQLFEAELSRAVGEQREPELRARYQLGRLRAISRAAATLSPDAAERHQEQERWLADHESEVFYNEIGGGYLLAADRLWELHEQASKAGASAAVAEEIAFAAATAPLGGECEGYLPCWVGATLRCEGRYLELHPRGRHAAELVAGIYWLQEAAEIDPELDPEGRAEALADLRKLGRLIEATEIPEREVRLRRLAELETSLSRSP